MEDGFYVTNSDDNDSIMSIPTQVEFFLEKAELANTTVAETDEEYDELLDPESRKNIQKCKNHHIGPKTDVLRAFEQLKENCITNPAPREPVFRDHHIAILEKAGNAIAYMYHWGSTHHGNRCSVDELAGVEVMTPCRDGIRLKPGGRRS
ncbi:hypothetical protein F5X99DRAFT_433000 [Biscogniauxia marginata]|nr:hypothetical protein F5X99DRAFT_433000 [Biscogniauxia marginata]